MARPRGEQSHYRPIAGSGQIINVTTSSAAVTNPFGNQVQVILVTPTADMFVALGDTPTAAANTDLFVPANTPIGLTVHPGERIAAITASGTGILYVSELSQ